MLKIIQDLREKLNLYQKVGNKCSPLKGYLTSSGLCRPEYSSLKLYPASSFFDSDFCVAYIGVRGREPEQLKTEDKKEYDVLERNKEDLNSLNDAKPELGFPLQKEIDRRKLLAFTEALISIFVVCLNGPPENTILGMSILQYEQGNKINERMAEIEVSRSNSSRLYLRRQLNCSPDTHT